MKARCIASRSRGRESSSSTSEMESGGMMSSGTKPAPEEIRQAREANPKMRERDLAAQLGVSEGDLVAAQVGQGAQRIEPRVNDVLQGLEAVGEVMALTRNESAVHEKIGVYDKVVPGERAAMVL